MHTLKSDQLPMEHSLKYVEHLIIKCFTSTIPKYINNNVVSVYQDFTVQCVRINQGPWLVNKPSYTSFNKNLYKNTLDPSERKSV